MHFVDVMKRDTQTFSFEFFPPATSKGAQALHARMSEFAALRPSFVSVTYGAGGSTRDRTHDLVVQLKDEGQLDPIPHLTCVGHSETEIRDVLQRYASHRVSNILALRGDRPSESAVGEPAWDPSTDAFRHAVDLVACIRSFNESGGHPDARGLGIGVAGFPEGHSETPNQLEHMHHLRAKVDAGADWITTQLFTDNTRFHDWRQRCELAGISVPIIAGIMPITSIRTMKRMADLAGGMTFPAPLLKRLYRHQDDPDVITQIGIQWAVEQCNELLDQEVAGIHFYTLNQSDATKRIFEALGGPAALTA